MLHRFPPGAGRVSVRRVDADGTVTYGSCQVMTLGDSLSADDFRDEDNRQWRLPSGSVFEILIEAVNGNEE
jgi:hypothetical protein